MNSGERKEKRCIPCSGRRMYGKNTHNIPVKSQMKTIPNTHKDMPIGCPTMCGCKYSGNFRQCVDRELLRYLHSNNMLSTNSNFSEIQKERGGPSWNRYPNPWLYDPCNKPRWKNIGI